MKSLSTAFRHIALASVASVCLALPLGSATQADTGTGASGSSTAPAASDGSSSSTEEVHPTGVDANGNRLSSCAKIPLSARIRGMPPDSIR